GGDGGHWGHDGAPGGRTPGGRRRAGGARFPRADLGGRREALKPHRRPLRDATREVIEPKDAIPLRSRRESSPSPRPRKWRPTGRTPSAASHQLAPLLHQPEPAVELLRTRHEGRIEMQLVSADSPAPLDVLLDLLRRPGEDRPVLRPGLAA